MRMTIFQLWVLSAVILGIAEVILIWHAYQGMENVPKNFLFHIRFWETMLAGNLQKIVILTLGLNILVFFGKWIQYIFLGRLRELESHKSGDRIRDYILMKTVFIGAVVGSGGGEDDDKEILIWFVWLTMVGFLKHFGLLCRDRLEYMTLSIRSSASEYARLMALLVLVLVGNAALVRLCLSVFGCWLRCPPGGLSALALLLFECVIITIDSAQTLVRFAVHFINEARGGRWEHRGFYLFSSELLCELVIQGLTLAHLLHVWALHGLSLSLTDALLFIHARAVLHSIRGRLAALRTYVTMDRRFRDASKEELLSHDDHCSICHEPMSSAKVLPCGHIFHLVCLRGWLEHSPTCPICRRAVQPTLAAAAAGGGAGAGAAGAHLNDGGEGGGGDGSDGGAGQEEAQAMQMLDNLDVFAAAAGEDMARAVAGAGDGGGVDGSGVDGGGGVAMLVGDEPVIRRQAWTIGWGGGTGWASWLPRFSIEVVRQHVTRGDPAGRRLFAVELSAGGGGVGLAAAGGDGGGSVRDSVVEAAVAQVLNVLPDLCPHAVRRDLLMTGDLQLTLENGLEGNIRYRSDPVGESPAPSPAAAAAAAATVAAAVPVSAAATAVVAVSAAAPAVVAVSPAAAAAAVAAPAQQQEGMSEGYAAGVAAEAMVGAGEAVAASALSKEIGIAASSVVEPCGVGLTGGVSREDELLAAAAGRGEQVIEIVSSGGVGSGVGCDEGGRTGGQQCAAGSDVYNAVNEITCVQGDGSASR